MYFSTFISGIQEFIPGVLRKNIRDVKITRLLDGAILYQTSANIESIKNIRFFNNSFEVIKTFEDPRDIDDMIKECIEDRSIGNEISATIGKSNQGKTFRIITSKENRLISADKKFIDKLESKIMRNGVQVDRSGPDIEFWFLQRRENIGIFMMRLTKHRAYEKVLQKGELRPEISSIMCLLSEPGRADIVIDPFCGYGSIIIERSKIPHHKIIGIDSDRKKIFDLKRKTKGKGIEIYPSNSLDLSRIKSDSIDKIITDPPWGIYEKINSKEFYERMLKEFLRVLRPGGICVILTSQKELTPELAKKLKIKIEGRFDILVSGKKAALFKMRKPQTKDLRVN
ncbi:MAG: methyltransferase domain-containing protein [Nanoarchaeota archaeon]|nr:methyltransferase domain-containing protein [Nanoarchaeota archaeon]